MKPPDTPDTNTPMPPPPDGGITTVPYCPPPEAATGIDPSTHLATPPELLAVSSFPTFKNYDVLGVIKSGGMGIIYQVRHKLSGRVEALKTIRPDLAVGEFLERFTREVQAVAKLDHLNVIRIYHVGLDEDPPHYTMEYLPGGTLGQHLASFVGDQEKAAEVIEKIAGAIHHVHQGGVYHRDLKPGNVLIKNDCEPIVTDFGLAKLREADVQITRPGAAVGTPAYMSPEQFEGRADIGAPTDIWALGVMLYELLAGKRPFEGDTAEIQRRVLQTTPAGVREHNANIDRVLEHIVRRCLVREPDWRFSSAEELAKHLLRWRQGDPIPIESESIVRRTRRFVRRHPRLVAAFTLLMLAAGIALGARIYLDPDRPLRNAYATLNAGQPVTLIGRRGPPLWMHWITAAHPIEAVVQEADPGYTISTASVDLLELLPAPGLDTYRLRAEVRHVDGVPSDGEVGLYFGRQSNEKAHVVWVLTFNDMIPPRDVGVNTIRFGIRVVPQDSRKSEPRNDMPPVNFVPAGANRCWRTLEILVGLDGVKVGWDGRQIAQQDYGALARRSQALMSSSLLDPQLFQGLAKSFDRERGWGLFASRSTADFRNVVIEPLPK
jgi:serine/threonine-protein kinase